ncbi:MAG: tRNA pseudouridine(13) synthase TruD [Myxococcota bacterium]
MRDEPEDFRVDEIPLYPPSGEGGHTFLRVEKRLRTTEEVARALAREVGCRPRDVGYAGRKDRRALTTQWFSVPDLDPEVALTFSLPGAIVLEASRHPHKLRTGHLGGNRFVLKVRGCEDLVPEAIEANRLRIRAHGLPNCYGSQRFGRDGDNAERARRALRGEEVGGDRRSLRFLFSALQAEVFNEALARREHPLERFELGDVAVVHASGGLFLVEDVDVDDARAQEFEISPTGPIFGTRTVNPTGAAAARERAAMEAHGVPEAALLELPPGIRLRGARRALRIAVPDLEVRAADGTLELRFGLPPGSYATVLVDELLGTTGASG